MSDLYAGRTGTFEKRRSMVSSRSAFSSTLVMILRERERTR
jgi:hypothetical protein